MTSIFEVAVIGGGSTGSSILYHLANKGIRNSILIDKGPQPGSGQTSKSTAVIRTHYTNEIVARMALFSYKFFKEFDRKVPEGNAGYVETGLILGASYKDASYAKETVRMLNGLGIDSRIIDKDEAEKIEPFVDFSAYDIIVYEPHSGYAEPSRTTSSFIRAAEKLGAKTLFNTEVRKIEKGSDYYTLLTTLGEIHAKKVVLATGVWSKRILASLGINVPILNVRHPIVICIRPDEYQGIRPIVADLVRALYYKPEGKILLSVGSLSKTLDTFGKDVDPDNYYDGVHMEEISEFSSGVMQAIPIMAKGKYQAGYAGIYDNTPDQQPIIDEFSRYGFEDLYCVIGLSGHGFKLCPEFGRIISSLICDGYFKDYDISVFSLKRFETGKLLTGKYSVSTIG